MRCMRPDGSKESESRTEGLDDDNDESFTGLNLRGIFDWTVDWSEIIQPDTHTLLAWLHQTSKCGANSEV